MPPLACAISCDAPKTASKPILSWQGRLALSPITVRSDSSLLHIYRSSQHNLQSAKLFAICTSELTNVLTAAWWMMVTVHATVMPFSRLLRGLFC